MARYIDADRIVVDAIKERKFVIQIQDMLNPEIIIRTAYADLEDFINSQPTADVEEVKRGYWKTNEEDIEWNNSIKRKYCSVCGKIAYWDSIKFVFILTDYCPHCGAKMNGERKEV